MSVVRELGQDLFSRMNNIYIDIKNLVDNNQSSLFHELPPIIDRIILTTDEIVGENERLKSENDLLKMQIKYLTEDLSEIILDLEE